MVSHSPFAALNFGEDNSLKKLKSFEEGNRLDIWCIRGIPKSEIARCMKYLTDDEKKRSERFLIPELSEQFVFIRAFQKNLFSAYLNCDVSELSLHLDSDGKPRLFLHGSEALRFNLTHSGNFFCIAVSKKYDIGVDIEHLNRKTDFSSIIKRYYSAKEYCEWLKLPDESKREAFFRSWTRKEAYLKGIGIGLRGLNTVEVSFDTAIDRKVAEDLQNPAEADCWNFHEFCLLPAVIGNCAIRSTNDVISMNLIHRDFSN
ncbi:MAG: 4'-phosphopantetheinyl transferase superfamily protein [Candidatus Riflebacteria bacterium]|nr:4'-phosphopantetheinyl transferase superfamily protein [Candidatus Riflebacteria bacterium]